MTSANAEISIPKGPGFALLLRAGLRIAADRLRRPAVALPVLAGLLATQVLPLFSPTPDGVGYLSIARSIAHGGPLANLGSPKLHYPIGYPLLISPLFWFSDRPLLLLVAAQWGFVVLFMLGVYCWARRWYADGALPITALALVNASLWMHARTTLSEPSFMAFMAWTACAMDRLVACTSARCAARWGLVVALLLMGLALIKPVGVLMAAGYGAAMFLQAWRGQTPWRHAALATLLVPLPAVAAVATLVAYEAHTAQLVGAAAAPTYLHEFKSIDASLPAQLIEGVRVRVTEIGRLALPGMFKAFAKPGQWLNANTAIYVPFVCLFFWAWWHVARRGGNALLLAFPFFFVLYVAYPQDQGTRYLLPMLPVIAVCVWWLICRLPRHRTAWLSAAIAAHLFVALAYSLQSTAHLRRLNADWPAIDALVDIVREAHQPACVYKLPNGVSEMVMLSADRYMQRVRLGDEAPEAVALLVARIDAADYPGFVEQSRAGRFKLLVRDERLTSSTGAPQPAVKR